MREKQSCQKGILLQKGHNLHNLLPEHLPVLRAGGNTTAREYDRTSEGIGFQAFFDIFQDQAASSKPWPTSFTYLVILCRRTLRPRMMRYRPRSTTHCTSRGNSTKHPCNNCVLGPCLLPILLLSRHARHLLILLHVPLTLPYLFACSYNCLSVGCLAIFHGSESLTGKARLW